MPGHEPSPQIHAYCKAYNIPSVIACPAYLLPMGVHFGGEHMQQKAKGLQLQQKRHVPRLPLHVAFLQPERQLSSSNHDSIASASLQRERCLGIPGTGTSHVYCKAAAICTIFPQGTSLFVAIDTSFSLFLMHGPTQTRFPLEEHRLTHFHQQTDTPWQVLEPSKVCKRDSCTTTALALGMIGCIFNL